MKDTTNNISPKSGDIFWIEATHAEKGSEQKKNRPGVLIKHYKYGDIWEIAPLAPGNKTRRGRDNDSWFRTFASGRDSIVLLNQRRAVSKERIQQYVGHMNKQEFESLRKRIIDLYSDEIAV
jgi:mRNA-degrading endonuclease toxin of MazEF toxin-antitoxin module